MIDELLTMGNSEPVFAGSVAQPTASKAVATF
jgi:hypothetical protein